MSDYDNRELVECTCAMSESTNRTCVVHGEGAPPNEVTVNADGCSCRGYCRSCGRSDVDPACPRHGEPITNGMGDVLIIHPDGNYSIIREPSA